MDGTVVVGEGVLGGCGARVGVRVEGRVCVVGGTNPSSWGGSTGGGQRVGEDAGEGGCVGVVLTRRHEGRSARG